MQWCSGGASVKAACGQGDVVLELETDKNIHRSVRLRFR
jgi:hypothetical protein